MPDTIDSLIAEYARWNDANGLNLGSADEHLTDPALTREQRRWLAEFCDRWDCAEKAAKMPDRWPPEGSPFQ